MEPKRRLGAVDSFTEPARKGGSTGNSTTRLSAAWKRAKNPDSKPFESGLAPDTNETAQLKKSRWHPLPSGFNSGRANRRDPFPRLHRGLTKILEH
jgi:hypothetical protein